MVKRTHKSKGAALAEYSILLALIGVGAITAVSRLGEAISQTYEEVETSLETQIGDPESVSGSSDPEPVLGGGEPGSITYTPPELRHLLTEHARANGEILLRGHVVTDTNSNGAYRYDPKYPHSSIHNPHYQKLYFQSLYEQEYYGEEETRENYGTTYFSYGQTYIFPPNWDPWHGM